MGTSAIIKVEGNELASVYQHYDGYPEHTLPWLEKFNKDFSENRGADPEYKFAQLLRSSAFDAEEHGLSTDKSTGFGLVPFDADYGQEYEYLLKKDGTVEVTKI